jgi:hypothetical protein
MEMQKKIGIVFVVLGLAFVGCGDDSAAASTKEGTGTPAGKKRADAAVDEDPPSTGRLRADASAVDPNSIADAGANAIEVAGSWSGEFADETIDTESWNGSSVVTFDNAENFAITQNADDAMYDPSKFNKLVWTEPAAGAFYYCTVDFGLATADEAKGSTKTADETDLEGAGCGGFPWSKLSKK